VALPWGNQNHQPSGDAGYANISSKFVRYQIELGTELYGATCMFRQC